VVFKGLPSRIGQLLDMSLRELEKDLYFESTWSSKHHRGGRQGSRRQEEGPRSVDKVRKLQEEHAPTH